MEKLLTDINSLVVNDAINTPTTIPIYTQTTDPINTPTTNPIYTQTTDPINTPTTDPI